jgi:hypothetical protein
LPSEVNLKQSFIKGYQFTQDHSKKINKGEATEDKTKKFQQKTFSQSIIM